MTLSNKRIALTGTLAGTTRQEFKKRVEDSGGIYVTNLDEAADILVVGDSPLESRIDKARRLGMTVVDKSQLSTLFSDAPASADDADVPLDIQPIGDAPPSVHLADRVRILDVDLEIRPPGPLTPDPSQFVHYTYDAPTLRMLRFVARAVKLGHPCLLEGETASSKTSAILHLAALTGHEVVRINLNGQTDTSELVGRYVPNEDDVRLPVDELMQHLELLEAESQMILKRAKAANRALSSVERQQIAANERIAPPQWRFQEGLVPQAMRRGWWIILDEVNLAEPPVLERLNSVLERVPTIVLTEGPGTRFGPGGDVAVHPSFRIFATMNPAEYQGRSVLSPAYKDRWVASWQAENPGEAEYRQMLDRMVHGRHPPVDVDGMRFSGQSGLDAPYARLGDVPGMDGFLSKLAALHTGLVRMATPGDGKAAALGSSRRERYVFSRRALLAVLDSLLHTEIVDPRSGARISITENPDVVAIDALERVYVDRVRGDEDRARVLQLMRSLGLARDGFLHRFAEP